MSRIIGRKRTHGVQQSIHVPIPATGPDVTTGLVSYWPMFDWNNGSTNTTLNDPVGSRDATLTNPNWVGSGLYFDSVGSVSAQAADNAAWDIASTMTVMVWIKATTAATQQWIISRYDSNTPDRCWGILADASSDKLRVLISSDGNSLSGSNAKDYTGSQVVLDNVLHSVGFRFNAGTLDLFVDGVKDPSPTKSVDAAITTIFTSDRPIAFGALVQAGSAVGGTFFTGNQSTAKIYNTHKTDADILGIHNLGLGAYQDYLARTSGLDSTHQAALKGLIFDLVDDGVIGHIDGLYIHANQDATSALENLRQNRFNYISNGSPSFSADDGFTGVNASTTVYLDTQFNPRTATDVSFTQDTGHLSWWSIGSGQASNPVGSYDGTISTAPGQRFGDDNGYFAVNSVGVAPVSSTDGSGHWIAERGSASASQAYRNGSTFGGAGSDGSGLPPNGTLHVLGYNFVGTGHVGSAQQLAMMSFGGPIGGFGVQDEFYNALRAYMTAVGVP